MKKTDSAEAMSPGRSPAAPPAYRDRWRSAGLRQRSVMCLICAGCLIALCLNACAIGPVHGVIYTGTSFAGEFNPANDVPREKTATGCTRSILALVSFGDSSVGAVALANGISRVATVDHSTTSVLTFVYRDYCTIVTGAGS